MRAARENRSPLWPQRPHASAGYDLLPTVHDLAGGRAALPAEIDGVSLRPLFRDPVGGRLEPPERPLFFHRPGKRVSAVRQGSHKLILTWARDGSIASRALYDLGADPIEEGRDIAARKSGTGANNPLPAVTRQPAERQPCEEIRDGSE